MSLGVVWAVEMIGQREWAVRRCILQVEGLEVELPGMEQVLVVPLQVAFRTRIRMANTHASLLSRTRYRVHAADALTGPLVFGAVTKISIV